MKQASRAAAAGSARRERQAGTVYRSNPSLRKFAGFDARQGIPACRRSFDLPFLPRTETMIAVSPVLDILCKGELFVFAV